MAYFEKHEGFNGGLELCEDGDFSADFTLEQRGAIRRQYGASQRITPGELVKTFFVRNKPGSLDGFQVLREGTPDFDGVIVHAFDRNKLVIAIIQRTALEDSVAFEVEGRPTIAQCANIVEFNLAVFSGIVQRKYARGDYLPLSRYGSTNPFVEVALQDIQSAGTRLHMPGVKHSWHHTG